MSRAEDPVVEHSSGPSGGARGDGRLKSGALPDISHVEYEGFEQDDYSPDDQNHEVVTAVREAGDAAKAAIGLII